jgi:hypothetical protein
MCKSFAAAKASVACDATTLQHHSSCSSPAASVFLNNLSWMRPSKAVNADTTYTSSHVPPMQGFPFLPTTSWLVTEIYDL